MIAKKRKYAKSYNLDSTLYDKLNQASYSQRLRIQIKRKRRNRILIMCSILLLTGIATLGTAYHVQNDNLQKSEDIQNKAEITEKNKKIEENQPKKKEIEKDILPEKKLQNPIDIVLNMEKVSAAVVTKEKNTEKKGKFQSVVSKSSKVGMDYFSDAVFLGDSRTEGLIISTGLSKAAFYGGKGMNVDTVFTEKVVKLSNSKSRVTPTEGLKKKKFKKIYVMFGVNELGWPYDNVFKEKYTKLIKEIKKHQPNAKIYVQSILPVSKEKETKDKIYNNKKIRKYNKLIKSMAKEQKVYYLDVAADIVNKDNVLPKGASTDGVHLNKSYCVKWLDYLRTHTVE